MPVQDTGLEKEANDAAARVAGVGGDKEDRYSLQVQTMQLFCMYSDANTALALGLAAEACKQAVAISSEFALRCDTMLGFQVLKSTDT